MKLLSLRRSLGTVLHYFVASSRSYELVLSVVY